MSATASQDPAPDWQCGLCESTKPPNGRRFLTIHGDLYLSLECERCGYPDTLARVYGGQP